MAKSLESKIWDSIQQVKFPGMSRDIVSFGFVHRVEESDGTARIELRVPTQNPQLADEIRRQVESVVSQVPEVKAVDVKAEVLTPPPPEARSQRATAADPNLIPEVEHVVAVASGKGGVGKSTIAANLAVALSQLNHDVGLLDADIYGPSVPMMFGIQEKPLVENERLVPFQKYGIKVMSLGFVLEVDTPVIWRGPMVVRAIEQMLGDVEWGRLDYMVVDLPPGTGDAQLTLAQKVPLSGAVIVSTPQDVALIDARKGLAMFNKVNVPVTGIIENMSTFLCPHCGEATDIFKRDGARRTALELGCPYLGSIPLDPAIVEGGDRGVPIVVSEPDGPHAQAFRKVAEAVVEHVGQQAAQRPKLKIV